MTYHTATSPADFSGIAHGLRANLAAFFSTLGHAIEINSTGHRRLQTVHALQAKSDDELAALGLKREDIVHRVFKDLFYM